MFPHEGKAERGLHNHIAAFADPGHQVDVGAVAAPGLLPDAAQPSAQAQQGVMAAKGQMTKYQCKVAMSRTIFLDFIDCDDFLFLNPIKKMFPGICFEFERESVIYKAITHRSLNARKVVRRLFSDVLKKRHF